AAGYRYSAATADRDGAADRHLDDSPDDDAGAAREHCDPSADRDGGAADATRDCPEHGDAESRADTDRECDGHRETVRDDKRDRDRDVEFVLPVPGRNPEGRGVAGAGVRRWRTSLYGRGGDPWGHGRPGWANRSAG